MECFAVVGPLCFVTATKFYVWVASMVIAGAGVAWSVLRR